MATCSSMSQTQGSDEIQEMYCEECENHDNIYVPAEGFCVQCVEYKCGMCIKFHRRHFRNHPLQDQHSMPQDYYFEKCTDHPKELIKYYCLKCDKLACTECKNHAHKNCQNVQHLSMLVKDVEQSKELKDLKENLEKVSKDIKMTTNQVESKAQIAYTLESQAKTTITKQKDKLISTYRQHQKEMIDQFDKKMEETIAKLKRERKELENELAEKQTIFEKNLSDSEQAMLKEVEESKANLDSMKAKNTTVTSDLKTLSAELLQAEALGQRCKLFVVMKDVNEHLENLQKNTLALQNTDIQYYRIEPLKTEVSVKTLESQTMFFSYKKCTNSEIERTATFHKEIHSKSKGYSSLCLLSENKLIQSDVNGKCLHIFSNISINTEKHDAIKMSSSPWGIAKVKDNKVAVTFPDAGIVRLITFSESMTVISTDDIPVGGECCGIACSNNNLIVSYDTNPGIVQILDMSGNVLKCFDKDCNGKPLFSVPWYLTLSPDNTTIYVSDYTRNTVTGMTLDGNVKAIYRNDQLRRPCQLTVDEAGTVYVCGLWSHNVHQLSSDLTKVKILLDESQGMLSPVSVAYCQNNNRLYVGMYNSSNIKVFNVSVE